MNLTQYLEDNTIIMIGDNHWPGYICIETISENPIELIRIALEANCYISEISWWDRALISIGSDIGGGGPLDPREPSRYYFAEMDICDKFSPKATIEEYIHYLGFIKRQYNDFDIYPALDIKPRPCNRSQLT